MERGPSEKTEGRASELNTTKEKVIPVLDGKDLEKIASKARIVGIGEVPEWLIDNLYLVSGYRVDFQRKRDLFKSLFMKHNELLNIWTHLIGGIIFICLLVHVCFNLDYYLMATKRLVFNEAAMEKIQVIFEQQHLYFKKETESILADVQYEAEHFDFSKHLSEMRECVRNYSSDFLTHCKENLLALKEIASGDTKVYEVTMTPILEMV